ncbi:hypothetical protein LTR49_020108 [Elasticomyces elasticus]|nr:hypothetical protein LTR49_020108 [Elasticomyces elasticus]
MKFLTCTFLAVAALAALGAAAPTSKKEEIKQLCSSLPDRLVAFHSSDEEGNFLVGVADLCDGKKHLLPGMYMDRGDVRGPYHLEDGKMVKYPIGDEDVAALAARGAAGKKEDIKELCRSDRYVQFHPTGENEWVEDDFLIYAADVCDDKKEHLKHGIHMDRGHVAGPIKYKKGARVWGENGTEQDGSATIIQD